MKRLLTLLVAVSACTSLPKVEPAPVGDAGTPAERCANHLRKEVDFRSFRKAGAALGQLRGPAISYRESATPGDLPAGTITWVGSCGKDAPSVYDSPVAGFVGKKDVAVVDLCEGAKPFGPIGALAAYQTPLRIADTGAGPDRIVCVFASDAVDLPGGGVEVCVSASKKFVFEGLVASGLFATVAGKVPVPAIRLVGRPTATLEWVTTVAWANMPDTAVSTIPMKFSEYPPPATTEESTAAVSPDATLEGQPSGDFFIVDGRRSTDVTLYRFDSDAAKTEATTYTIDPVGAVPDKFIFGDARVVQVKLPNKSTPTTAIVALGGKRTGNGELGRSRLDVFYAEGGQSTMSWNALARTDSGLDSFAKRLKSGQLDVLASYVDLKVSSLRLDAIVALGARGIRESEPSISNIFAISGSDLASYGSTLDGGSTPSPQYAPYGELPGFYGIAAATRPLASGGTVFLAFPKVPSDPRNPASPAAWSQGACDNGVVLALPAKQ